MKNGLVSSGAAALGLILSTAAVHAQTEVTTVAAPNGGFRPRAVMDADGVLHVVQASVESRTDLVYLRQEPGSDDFSEPIRVNTTPGIVASFDMAVGGGGRVHVLIRTNPRYLKLQMPEKEKFKIFDLKYMLHTRLNDAGDAFEEEKNLAGDSIAFEGVGTLLASGDDVYAFWHGQLEPQFNEPGRDIYRAVSSDAGKTFSKPVAVDFGALGACQCCPMASTWDAEGNIVLAFRNSQKVEGKFTKDAYLLVSEDLGKTFEAKLLHPWNEAGCPGSLFSATSGPAGVFVGWRTKSKVFFAKSDVMIFAISPTKGAVTRAPVVVSNDRGEVLFVWSAAPQGGAAKASSHLVWQLFDEKGAAISEKGVLRNGVADRWGAPTAFARPDGSFVILHDGPGE